MRSSDCIFCPGYDGVFRLYAGTEKFQERSQRKPGDLKGKMAQGGLTAGSIKPVSDPGAGPSLWGSYGDRRHTGNSFCKGLHSYRSYGNGQLPDRMDDPVFRLCDGSCDGFWSHDSFVSSVWFHSASSCKGI